MPRHRHRRRQKNSLLGLWIGLGVLGGLVLVLLIVLLVTMDGRPSPNSPSNAAQQSSGVENLFGTSTVDDGSPVIISEPQFIRDERGHTLLRMNYEIKRLEDIPESHITILMESGQVEDYSNHMRVPHVVPRSQLSNRGTFDLRIFQLDQLPAGVRFPDARLSWQTEDRRISNVLIVPMPTGPGSLPPPQRM